MSRSSRAVLPGGELQYAITGLTCLGMLQRFPNSFFQCMQLEWLAQDTKLRCCRWRHVAVAACEQNRNPRVSVADFLRQGNAIHSARHDDIAENERYPLAALQPAQSIHGIARAYDPITELLQ